MGPTQVDKEQATGTATADYSPGILDYHSSLNFSIPNNQNSYVADAAAPWGDVASAALIDMVVELDDLVVLPKRAARVLGLVHRAAEEVLLV
jgi:hypothetical protein